MATEMLSIRKNRSEHVIIRDFLAVMQDNPGTRKTLIIRLANLNDAMFNRYADGLIANKHIIENGGVYTLTKKGIQYLTILNEMMSLIEEKKGAGT